MSNAEPIIIEDVIVEVESGSFLTNTGHPNLTSSLLYGLSTTITSSQTESILQNQIEDNSDNPNYGGYISQSIVRARIKSKIKEPFGPITSDISASIITNVPKILGAAISYNHIELDSEESYFNDDSLQNSIHHIFDIGNSALEPLSTNNLTTINVAKIEIKGDLIANNPILSLNIGGWLFINSVHLDQGTDTEGNSFGNDNGYAPVFIGEQGVNISGGSVDSFRVQVYNNYKLE